MHKNAQECVWEKTPPLSGKTPTPPMRVLEISAERHAQLAPCTTRRDVLFAMPLATQEFTAWIEGLRLSEDVRLYVPPDEDELTNGRDGSAVCHRSLFEAAELANALEASLSRGHMFQLDHRSTEMVGGAKPSRAR